MIQKLLLLPRVGGGAAAGFIRFGASLARARIMAMEMEPINSPRLSIPSPPHATASSAHNSPTTRKLERLFSMQGGKGETSYAKNSQGQAKHWKSVRPLLEETLKEMALPTGEETVCIADLGCSFGQNTLGVVGFVVDELQQRYKRSSLVLPEFQAFFSDLPSNDFNTLFHLIDDTDTCDDSNKEKDKDKPRSYYAAGVPGSFYRRLFPRKSIHVFHSSFSLHWLSQVPDEVQDRSLEAFNKGRVFIHGGPEAPAEAYLAQFRRDFESFLRARAEETKRGGCMFLVCLGRSTPQLNDQGGGGILFGTHFESAWSDLVQEGVIEEEERDTFNLPLFAPTAEELLGVVESEGSFRANKVETVRGGSPLVVKGTGDAEDIAKEYANTCKTVCGVLVEDHIGADKSNQLFKRVGKHAVNNASWLLENLQFYHVVASLTKK